MTRLNNANLWGDRGFAGVNNHSTTEEVRPTKKDYIEAASQRIQHASEMGMRETAIRVELSTMWDVAAALPAQEPLDVELVRQVYMNLDLPHDSWSCKYPGRGEKPCDYSLEAEQFAAEYARLREQSDKER